MSKTQSIISPNLEQFIEQKVLEIIGDPDSGLQLKKDFKLKLEERLKNHSKRTSHKEVLKKFV
ncbi:MAG: hypothetical protein NT010_04660 [Proteobacteria bacterium]|nr:hypothetical protein [Pseudomonadota bacterium]